MDFEAEHKRCNGVRLAQQKADKQRQQLEEEVDKLQARVAISERDLQEETDRSVSDRLRCQQLQSQVSELEDKIKAKDASIDEMER